MGVVLFPYGQNITTATATGPGKVVQELEWYYNNYDDDGAGAGAVVDAEPENMEVEVVLGWSFTSS